MQRNGPHGVGMRGLADAVDELLGPAPVADEVGDRDEQQVVLGTEALEIGHPRHRAVVVDDLAQHPGGVEPGEPGQIDGGLGVAGPLEHAARPGAQREDVTGPGQVVATDGGVGQGPDGQGPVAGRDARGGALDEVDRVGEGGAVALGVALHHEGQIELVAALARRGRHRSPPTCDARRTRSSRAWRTRPP